MTRIEKFEEIAKQNGVRATLREVKGTIYASINGVTFIPRGFASFDAKCKELKNYVAPQPIDLTSRLIRIEESFFQV